MVRSEHAGWSWRSHRPVSGTKPARPGSGHDRQPGNDLRHRGAARSRHSAGSPNRRRRYFHAEACGIPIRVLAGQPEDQCPDVPADGRSAVLRLGLAAADDVAVPAQDLVRCDQRPQPPAPRFGIRPSRVANSARSAQVQVRRIGCGCRKPRPCHATRRYSLIRPPTRVCLRTRCCSRSTGSGSGFSGAAPCRER
jgi:hypothetical protein